MTIASFFPRQVADVPATATAMGHDAAVVDIGSNSVRLVLYRIEGRAIWTVYNEKVLAGLGRDLAATGKLSAEGVTAALLALRRFRAVIDGVAPEALFVAATAAVRDAADGPAFMARVEAETGLAIRLLSGAEEARFSALGVRAGAPAAKGVVGDLGGASLELIRLTEAGVGEGVTLPLGPFSLGAERSDPDKVRKIAAQRLAKVAKTFGAETFHAVGGAWRNVALIHMRLSNYPLQVVHQYEISRREALDAARLIARQSPKSLESMPGISKKRLETVPYAAALLETLIDGLGLQTVAISAFGLREGLLFDAMSPALRQRDPLVEGCAALGGRVAAAEDLGKALEAWLWPAFRTLDPVCGERDAVLAAAACRLADYGSRLHPDHRADLVFEQVLRSPVVGQSHAERVFLALAVHARHTSRGEAPEPATVARLLTPERRARALALGAAIRLGCDLSGRSPALLRHSRLALEDGALKLTADPAWADMLLGEQTAKRADTLAKALGVTLEMRGA